MKNTRPVKAPFMLRFGVEVFRRLSKDDTPPLSMDEVHVLNRAEQAKLRWIEWIAILRGAWIGTFAALIFAVSWPLAEWILGPAEGSFWNQWKHYTIMMGLVVVATVLEIVLLYWNALVAVHKMAKAAGLQMYSEDGEPQTVINALVAVAMELPNSREETLFAQPGREVSGWWIAFVTLIYRLKVTLTYYISRALMQRMLGRVVVRWAIEFIAVPVYAFWDALVTFWVMRQARVCTMGPSAVLQFVNRIKREAPTLSEPGRMAMLCSVGSTVARNSHLHPNVELLLRELVKQYGAPQRTEIDNSDNLLELLGKVDEEEQSLALKTLAISLIIDGRASIWERRLLQKSLQACGRSDDLRPLLAAMKKFKAGEQVELDALLA